MGFPLDKNNNYYMRKKYYFNCKYSISYLKLKCKRKGIAKKISPKREESLSI
jgi:hypothetical protein